MDGELSMEIFLASWVCLAASCDKMVSESTSCRRQGEIYV